jgi:hypothetical protein
MREAITPLATNPSMTTWARKRVKSVFAFSLP